MGASGEGWQLDHIALFLFFFVNIAVAIAIVLIKYKSLASIGIHKKNLWPALRLGLLFSLIPLSISIVMGLLEGRELNPIGYMMFMLLLFFFYAACEDIIFVGFIQTRLYGLFKTDRIAVFVGSALFTLIHILSRLVSNGISFSILLQVLLWFLLYQIMVSLSQRYFSIIAVTLLHTSFNWATSSVWESSGMISWIVFGALLIAESVWRWNSRRHSSKMSE